MLWFSWVRQGHVAWRSVGLLGTFIGFALHYREPIRRNTMPSLTLFSGTTADDFFNVPARLAAATSICHTSIEDTIPDADNGMLGTVNFWDLSQKKPRELGLGLCPIFAPCHRHQSCLGHFEKTDSLQTQFKTPVVYQCDIIPAGQQDLGLLPKSGGNPGESSSLASHVDSYQLSMPINKIQLRGANQGPKVQPISLPACRPQSFKAQLGPGTTLILNTFLAEKSKGAVT